MWFVVCGLWLDWENRPNLSDLSDLSDLSKIRNPATTNHI